MIDVDVINHYTTEGIIVHPLTSPVPGNKNTGKNPIVSDWANRTAPYSLDFLKQNIAKGCNIGANCGKASNLTVIDVDYDFQGIWDSVFEGIDRSSFCIQQRTEKDGKKHLFFKYTPELKDKTYQELGFDVRNDGGNIVLAPSIHFEGDTYRLLSPIETRPELPEIAVKRINDIISTYRQLKQTLAKCRHCFLKLWEAVFKDKNTEMYHDTLIFRQAEGRTRHLMLFAELKANGATEEQLTLACMLIFGKFFDPVQSEKNLKGIDAGKTAKTSTLQADEYYSKYIQSRTIESSEAPTKSTTEEVVKELTTEEIQARKDVLRDRRLPLVLPPDHFVSVFCDWLGGLTDGYEEYQKLGAIWLISSFCSPNVYIKLKQETVKPNVFITLFGKSTTARKSTVVQRTRLIYEAVTGEYLPNEDFSIEGYLESLAMNPVQHHVRDEVAGFLAKIHKQYNDGFNELECAVYDGQNFRKTLASKGAKEPKTFDIRNPYVTKFYATTPDNYMKFMTIEDFLCGREYRTLFCFPTYIKNKLPLGVETQEDTNKWITVLQRASEIHQFIQSSSEVNFNFDADALSLYSTFTSDIEDEADKTDNGVLCSAVGRSQIHILKLAMLIELGKSPISTTITKSSIEIAANAVTSYFIPTLLDVVDRLQEDAKNNMIERVVSVLRRCGGAVQHTKALHDAKLKSKDFAEVIATLEESETIEVVRERGTKKIYYILSELKTNIDLKSFENLPSLQNLSNLFIPNGKNSEEILETSKKFTLSVPACNSNNNLRKSSDSLPCEIKQSKNITTLQNLSVCSTMRDGEIPEISEILEISKKSLGKGQITELEALDILEQEGL